MGSFTNPSMAESEENKTENSEQVSTKPEESKIPIVLGLTLKDSLLALRFSLFHHLVILAICGYFIINYLLNPDPDNVLQLFAVKNIWIPLSVIYILLTCCVLFHVFALTNTTVRYMYIYVFYVCVFNNLVRVFFCTYMLVVIFTKHVYFLSDKQQVITYDDDYIIIGSIIFAYFLLDGLLIISFLASIYLKMKKVQKSLTKYWFVRLVIILFIDLFLVGYYIYLQIIGEFSYVYTIFIFLCLSGALLISYFLKIEFCEPNQWTPKNFDDVSVPPSNKIKIAIKIMEMKEETKNIAQQAAAAC